MLKLKIVKNKPLKLKIGEIDQLKLKISQTCPSIEVDALLQKKTCCPSAEEVVITPDEGYDGLELVTVQATPLEETTVTPQRTTQIVKPSEEVVGLSSVEVKPVTKDIDDNIIPSNIKKNVEILGVVGTLEEKVPIILQEKRVSASSTNEVTVVAGENYDGLEKVVVNKVTHEIDSDIIPTNIREGIDILGVTGTYKAEPLLQNKTVNPSEEGSEVTYDEDYNGLGKVTVNPIKASMIENLTPDVIKKDVEVLNIVGTYGATSQIKYATPSQEEQIIKPDSGIEFLSQVTIQPVTSGIDEDIIPDNIRKGKNILGVEGTFDGDLSFQKKSVSANAEEDLVVTPDYGYDALDSVTVKKVTSSIDSDITPENIKKGIEILGVEGTYEPDPSMEDKYIYPATYEKTVYPDEGYSYFDKVTIAPVTSSIDSDINSSNIKEGVTILGIEGTLEPVKGQEIFITPTKEAQVITPDLEAGKNAITKATVNPVTSAIDSNIVNTNIKKGVSILGVEGSYEGASSLQTKTVTPTNESQQVIADVGYDALSSVTVEATPVEDITIDPSMETKTYSPSDGKFINNVTVNQVTSDVDANIVPENIKQNMSILGVVGTYTGEQQNHFATLNKTGTASRGGILASIYTVPDDLVITVGKYQFLYCSSLVKAPKLDYSDLTDCTSMFESCGKMTDTTGLVNFKKVTTTYNMFTNCSNITHMDLTSWNPTNITTVQGMFYYCTKLVEVDMSNWVNSKITTFKNAFGYCRNLTKLNLENANFTACKNFEYAFMYCDKLISVDLSSFHYAQSMNTYGMFNYCTVLQHIDIRNLDISKSTSYTKMFKEVPTDCEIIVMNDTCKTWMATNFATMTNVKTVAEYEAEQGA